MLRLGCGLIRLGRPWGYRRQDPLGEQDAQRFLDAAYELGITYFDTAPAYGFSEKRLGKFLARLTSTERGRLRIATKWGEYWNHDGTTTVNHAHDAAVESIQRSVDCLGRIDMVQLHKATGEVLRSEEVQRTIEWLGLHGLPVGASVSDVDSARTVICDRRYTSIQFPLNQTNPTLLSAVPAALMQRVEVVINRPLAMGALVADGESSTLLVSAFRFIVNHVCEGVVLTGTADVRHLHANVAAFQEAVSIAGDAGTTSTRQ